VSQSRDPPVGIGVETRQKYKDIVISEAGINLLMNFFDLARHESTPRLDLTISFSLWTCEVQIPTGHRLDINPVWQLRPSEWR